MVASGGQQRVCLITGGGSGIGRACAIALSNSGFQVALLGRKPEMLAQTAEQIGDGKALQLPCDITDPDQVELAFARLLDRFGRLDVLFNNAGTSAPKAEIEDVELKHWNRVFAVNVTGSFLCAQHAFRIMKAQTPRGGRIINNGSVSAHVPRPLGVAYTASKHAVTGLTRQLALDGRRYDIACGQIDIGNAETDGAAALIKGMPQPDGRIVPEPVMPLQSVADAVVFMASQPLVTNVQFMTVLASGMPFIGRG